MIADRHPIAASPAHDDPLQERRALARRAPPSLTADGLRVLPQTALIFFKLVPRDIAGVGSGEERRPLVAWQPLNDRSRLGATLPTAAEKEDPSETRIVEHPQRAGVLQRHPARARVVDAVARVAGK